MDVGIDIKFVEVDSDGDICTEFSMQGAKPVHRWFKNMEAALTMATFVAAQAGIVKPEDLIPWLEERGFPGRQPGEGTEVGDAVKKVQIEEITED